MADAAESTTLEIRVGYFGICANPNKAWTCNTDKSAVEALNTSALDDPFDLLAFGTGYREDISFPGLL